MSVWNEQYKTYPPNHNNPGYGAESIRDLKSNLEGVFASGHNFDTADIVNQGRHLAGTAIIDLDDDSSAKNNLQVGRLKGTTNPEETTAVVLEVKGTSSDLVIKGYQQVSQTGDETINGLKTFITAPIITETVDDSSDDDTIANVGYVKLKTDTTEIEPTVNNVGPDSNIEYKTYADILIGTINDKADTDNLEELLVNIKLELSDIRTVLSAVSPMSPYDQNLKDDGSPTFAGLTVTGTITADKVYGAVWG